ncbi:hypothetical protein BGW36DRAFT_45636 [Talaromyces proteolyticus]|uniref:Uncharacterized protein n=1 Tax=Talaromyces proteolyticus TaxID=1131652 RepID=A0AAD4KKR6_9EURO|nr:uncharacterized protein BGW36DRAFT_45636 [Talaromyces proteolyticus]KAH8692408.1 hypothetical protein BGW36DRAFT_45636 [Talaromyces proteolyticus]
MNMLECPSIVYYTIYRSNRFYSIPASSQSEFNKITSNVINMRTKTSEGEKILISWFLKA